MASIILKIRKATDDLEVQVRRVKDLKEAAVAASSAFEEAQAELIERLNGQKSIKGGGLRATVVTGSTVKINEEGLKKALGAPMWNKVTKKVLDKPKLEEMVNSGDVDINTVSQYTTVSLRKPYLSFSTVLEPESE